MTDKLKNYLKTVIERAKGSLSLKNILLWVIIILLTLFAISLVILVTYKLIAFIISNFEILIIGIGFFTCVIIWIKEHAKDRREKRQQVNMDATQENDEIAKIRAEENYKLIRQCLYLVNNDMASVTGLQRIGSLTEMDTPNHYVVRNGFYLYQYLIAKNSEMIDASNLKVVLSRRLEQRIMAQEFSGITQTIYIHSSGRSYPILCIDEITDMGSYIQIDVAWSGKAYCEYLENKEVLKRQMNPMPMRANMDKDF